MTKPYKLLRDKMTSKSRDASQSKTEKMLKDIKKTLKNNPPKKK